VVYVHDGRIPEEPVGRRLTARLGGAAGTADEERSGFATVSGQAGTWSWRASGFARETEDIDIPGFAKSDRLLEAEGNPEGIGEPRGTLPNSHARAHGGSLGLSRIGACGFVGASVSAFSTEYGVPNEPDVHIEMDRVRLDARGRSARPIRALKEVSWAAAYADYEHTEFEGSEAGTVFEQQAVEGRVEAVHCPLGRWEGAAGFQGSFTDLTVTGEESLLPEARTTAAALFLVERTRLSRAFTFEAGARCDVTWIDSVGDETFVAPSLSASIVLAPTSRTTWALSTAFTQRAPTAFELYADGPHVATNAFEVGDPDLGLERALGADLSFRHDGRRVAASATAYWQRYLDYIGLDPTGAVDVDSGLPVFAYHETEAEIHGVEGDAALHVWRCGERQVDVLVQGDWVRGTDLDGDAPLARMPPPRLGGGIAYRDDRWLARVDVLHAFRQTRSAPFELDTDGYTLLDAGVTCSLCVRRLRVTATVAATNLLDEEVRKHTSFVKDLAPGPGRSFRFSVEVEF
jgi:iron complex outermembrane receptor protein